MLDEKRMASVLARLRECPGVFAAALMDPAGKCIAQDVAEAARPAVERAVASLVPVLEEMRRTEPTWTSVFLDLGTDYVVGRRFSDLVILVLAHPPLSLGGLDQVLDKTLEGVRDSLAASSGPIHMRFSTTVQLSDEDVVWLNDDEDGQVEDLLYENALGGHVEHSAPGSGASPQAIPPESEFTDKMSTQEVARLPAELAAVTNIIERHGELQRHLEMAKWVQTCLLPEQSFLEHPFVDITAQFYPADICSGDWWAVDPLPDGRVLFVIGDVTGHGVGPAMVTAIARGAYDVTCAQLGAQMTCEALLRSMNGTVYRAAHHSLLMTCAACILDPASSTLSVANAGHTLPLLTRQWDDKIHIREIVSRGSPLGSAAHLDISTRVVSVEPDDVLFWYTDGVIDCENEQGEQFGRKRLLRVLHRQTVREPAVICDTIRHLLDCFRGNEPQSDDVVFAAARIKG